MLMTQVLIKKRLAAEARRNLTGVALAEAQLKGQDNQLGADEPELELPPISISVYPVRTRVRTKVGNKLKKDSVRAIKNWLACKPESRDSQRPLVLTYDSESEFISSKFAADWTELDKPRIYF